MALTLCVCLPVLMIHPCIQITSDHVQINDQLLIVVQQQLDECTSNYSAKMRVSNDRVPINDEDDELTFGAIAREEDHSLPMIQSMQLMTRVNNVNITSNADNVNYSNNAVNANMVIILILLTIRLLVKCDGIFGAIGGEEDHSLPTAINNTFNTTKDVNMNSNITVNNANLMQILLPMIDNASNAMNDAKTNLVNNTNNADNANNVNITSARARPIDDQINNNYHCNTTMKYQYNALNMCAFPSQRNNFDINNMFNIDADRAANLLSMIQQQILTWHFHQISAYFYHIIPDHRRYYNSYFRWSNELWNN